MCMERRTIVIVIIVAPTLSIDSVTDDSVAREKEPACRISDSLGFPIDP
jgi:hypothetical protein